MASNETFTYGIQITSDSSGAIKDFKAGGNSAEKFAKSLGDLDKKSAKSGKQFKKTGKEVGKLQKGFREASASAALIEGPLGGVAGRLTALSAVAGRGNIALAGLGLTFAALSFAATKAIGVYAETEHQLAQLEAQLELTGYAAGFTTEELDLMARGIARNTLASTQDMREAISVMLTFTSVTGQVFEDAIVASNNLAQVMGGSVKSAAIQLGKALEDPRVGLTALRRSGVSFTSEQRALIISLVDAGKKSEAMAEALKVLNSQLPDAAAGVGQLKGEFDSLSQSTDELLESFGKFSVIRKITLGATISAREAADAMREFIDPDVDNELDELMQKRLDLMIRIGQEGRKQGENTLSAEARELEKQINSLIERRDKKDRDMLDKLAQGSAKRQQRELDEQNRLLISNGIKEGVIRTRTEKETGAAITKIQEQVLKQRLDSNLISIDAYNKEVTALRLAQNQREIDELKDMRLQLQDEEAQPIVKYRADQNIKRKEIERDLILKQGVVDLAEARKKASDERAKQGAAAVKREQEALKKLETAQIALLKSSGNAAAAAEKEITQRYASMLANLPEKSKIAGQQIVDNLISQEKLEIELDELKDKVDRTLADMGNQERSIDVSVNTGLLTEFEGRSAVLDLHKETAVTLEAIVADMEKLALLSADPNALQGVDSLKVKVQELATETSILETHLRDSLGGAFSDVFQGIGRDIHSASDALEVFTRSVLQSFADIAAQEASAQLAKLGVSALGGIGGIIGGLFHDGGDNINATSGKRVAVNPALFKSAPRFHDGLRADEFPAILQTGEDVISRNDPRNSQFGGGGSSKTTNLSITVPVSVEGGDSDQRKLQEISQIVKVAVTKELVKEKRQGGLLA